MISVLSNLLLLAAQRQGVAHLSIRACSSPSGRAATGDGGRAGALAPLHYDLLAATLLAGAHCTASACRSISRSSTRARRPRAGGTGKNVEGRWSIGQTAVVTTT
jgi:hypothetical protein